MAALVIRIADAVKAARERRTPKLAGEDDAVGPGPACPIVGPLASLEVEAGFSIGVVKGGVDFQGAGFGIEIHEV